MKVALVVAACSSAVAVSPIQKTIQLLGDLEAKIQKEGEAAQKQYEEYSEWCEDRSRDLGYEIKTGTGEVAELKATIAKADSSSEELSLKIDDVIGNIASDDADMTAATNIRSKEAVDFAAEEKELSETISMLERAIAIIEKEMSKGNPSMLQMKGALNIQKAFAALVQASALSSADAGKLTSLVQSQSDDDDALDNAGAPAASVYSSQSGGILETLESILEKAETQLSDLQKSEVNKKNNFLMLKQSLEDEIKFANKEKDDAAKALAASGETKASATGDLSVTSKALAEDQKNLGQTHQDCMTKAEEFESETKSRAQEVTALAAAKKAVSEMATAAGDVVYSSFLQTNSHSALTSRADLANFEAVRYVRDLARKEHSTQLAQLASRMASVLRLGGKSGDDPFGKVKVLISDMIAKLERDQADSADLKAWCDKETEESDQKKLEASTQVEHLGIKIESATAKSKKLKEQVASLQSELAQLASTQAQMMKIRSDEKSLFNQQKPEMEQGIQGVKLALKILSDYFSQSGHAHIAQEGGSTGIIAMLEVVESDFTKGLAEMTAAEDTAEAMYQRQTAENSVEKKMKGQDVKYKTQAATKLNKDVTDLSTDREGVQAELDAVLEYRESLTKKCTYKAESYSERSSRRAAEISGLKQALEILSNEVALIQESHGHRSLRGVHRHV